MLRLLIRTLCNFVVLSLVVGCVPTSDATTAAPACSLELDLSATDAFVLQSSEVTETAASYRVILRGSLRELNAVVQGQLETQGWQFAGTQSPAAQSTPARDSRTRQRTRVASRYTCTDDPDKALNLSIAPVGRSFIHLVRLQLE